ncbi:hypothetical protein KFK09_019654 [Dendrobium nobile]|uniref:Uncharacterized protein n=1 Tax=Dendrobium nobile TaxID=94219 RepID=A0A8T3AST3_DENNO|nr:hypothetical protein KFK09_019654 [Dendrobium nobile]
MGCSYRRRRSNKSFPSPLAAEEPATTAVVEPVVIRAKSSRSQQWRPALADISEDGAAASGDYTADRLASLVLTRRGSVKTSSRIRPQAAAERNSWHQNNQTTMPSLSSAGFFIF